MGQWMKVNGDSIYGTTYGPWQNLPFGRTTAKGKAIYLHVFDWPSKPELELPALTSHVSRVTLLATGHKIHFKQKKDRLLITVPSVEPDPNDSVLRIDTK
jgi:alpha-L-fucosidase